MLMAAANVDDDVKKKGLIPKKLGNSADLNKKFKEHLLKLTCKENFHHAILEEKLDFSKSPFLKQTLLSKNCYKKGFFPKTLMLPETCISRHEIKENIGTLSNYVANKYYSENL